MNAADSSWQIVTGETRSWWGGRRWSWAVVLVDRDPTFGSLSVDRRVDHGHARTENRAYLEALDCVTRCRARSDAEDASTWLRSGTKQPT